MRTYFFTVLIKGQNLILFLANHPVNKHSSISEVICRCRSTYEGCGLIFVVTSSVGDSELTIEFQEACVSFFSNCYNKQDIHSNLPSYRPMNHGTVLAKVYPENVQPIKENNCRLFLYIYNVLTISKGYVHSRHKNATKN